MMPHLAIALQKNLGVLEVVLINQFIFGNYSAKNCVYMDFSIPVRSLILVSMIFGYTYLQRNLDFHTSVCMVSIRFVIFEYYLCSHM